jgi:hypothetical protein
VTEVPKPPESAPQPDSGVDGASGQGIPEARQPVPGETTQDTGTGPPGAAGPTGVDPAAADEPVPPRRSRRRVLGIVLAVVVGAVGMLCVGAIGTGLFVYHQISEPDRSTPGVVVRQYLEATFEDRDETKAARFTCVQPTQIGAVQQMLTDIVSREKRFGIHITVGWENFEARAQKSRATVAARMKITVPEESGQSSESFQQWNFTLKQDSGWRVCDAQRVS